MVDLWDNIKTFYIIIRQQSFKQAAAHLALNPSTISRHIKQLEDIIGYSLFDSRYPIALSPYGKKLFQYIESPCNNLLNIDNFKKQQDYVFTMYVNDLYFFHLLNQIYDFKLVHEVLSFSNISISDDDNLIFNVVAKQQNNFIYVTADGALIEKISKNTNYIYWSIYNIPICHFFTKDLNIRYTNFFHYNGTETWLAKIHNDYISANKITNENITTSNSIELIFNLIRCNGHSILPGVNPDPNSKLQNATGENLKSEQIDMNKLFFICHSSDVFLKLIF